MTDALWLNFVVGGDNPDCDAMAPREVADQLVAMISTMGAEERRSLWRYRAQQARNRRISGASAAAAAASSTASSLASSFSTMSYHELLKNAKVDMTEKDAEQIEKDLGRTFGAGSKARQSKRALDALRNLLYAAVVLSQNNDGYSQGQAFLAALSLSVLMNLEGDTCAQEEDEELAFELYVLILGHLPSYFNRELSGLRRDLVLLDGLLRHVMPASMEVLQEGGVQWSFAMHDPIMTMWSSGTTLESSAIPMVFDLLFVIGSDFRFAMVVAFFLRVNADIRSAASEGGASEGTLLQILQDAAQHHYHSSRRESIELLRDAARIAAGGLCVPGGALARLLKTLRDKNAEASERLAERRRLMRQRRGRAEALCRTLRQAALQSSELYLATLSTFLESQPLTAAVRRRIGGRHGIRRHIDVARAKTRTHIRGESVLVAMNMFDDDYRSSGSTSHNESRSGGVDSRMTVATSILRCLLDYTAITDLIAHADANISETSRLLGVATGVETRAHLMAAARDAAGRLQKDMTSGPPACVEVDATGQVEAAAAAAQTTVPPPMPLRWSASSEDDDLTLTSLQQIYFAVAAKLRSAALSSKLHTAPLSAYHALGEERTEGANGHGGSANKGKENPFANLFAGLTGSPQKQRRPPSRIIDADAAEGRLFVYVKRLMLLQQLNSENRASRILNVLSRSQRSVISAATTKCSLQLQNVIRAGVRSPRAFAAYSEAKEAASAAWNGDEGERLYADDAVMDAMAPGGNGLGTGPGVGSGSRSPTEKVTVVAKATTVSSSAVATIAPVCKVTAPEARELALRINLAIFRFLNARVDGVAVDIFRETIGFLERALMRHREYISALFTIEKSLLMAESLQVRLKKLEETVQRQQKTTTTATAVVAAAATSTTDICTATTATVAAAAPSAVVVASPFVTEARTVASEIENQLTQLMATTADNEGTRADQLRDLAISAFRRMRTRVHRLLDHR